MEWLIFVAAGAPVHGYSEPAVYHSQHFTHQPGPAVFADQGHAHGPVLQSSGEASLSSMQGSQQVPASQTVNDATLSSELESVPVSEASTSLSGDSGTATERSDRPLANIKEKTPMCLINELARFNKVCFLIIFGRTLNSQSARYSVAIAV